MKGKSKDGVKIIKDPLTYEWLFKCVVFLGCTTDDGFPAKMEKARDEMIEDLREWTENLLSDIEIENYARKLRICDKNTQNGILITWSKYGLLYYKPFGSMYPTIGNFYAKNMHDGYMIEGTAFEQDIEKPSDISERYDILRQEKLKANINKIYDILDHHITKAYVQDTLMGNRTSKIKKPDTIRKKIIELKKVLDNMDYCYDRVEEVKQYVTNKLYDPAAMEDYVKDCITMTNAFYNAMNNHYNEILKNIDEYEQCNNTRGYSYTVENIARILGNRTDRNYSAYYVTNTEKAFARALSGNDTDGLIMPMISTVETYYHGLENYYSAKEKAVFQKYLSGSVNTLIENMPDLFKTNIIEQLSKVFPELFNLHKEKYGSHIYSPMENAINAYNKLKDEYERFLWQFILRVYQGWNQELRENIYEYKFVLPDEELTQIISEICTDLDKQKQESLNGFYAYKNDFEATFEKRISIMNIDWDSMFNCEISHDAADENNRIFRVFSNYDHGISRYCCSIPLERMWKCIVPKLMKDYISTGKLNTKFYAEQIKNFVNTKFPKKIDDTKDLDHYGVYLIPKNNDHYKAVKQMLYRLLDKMNNAVGLIETGLLSSNDTHFLTWCMNEKLVDQDLVNKRIEELENTVPVIETA